MTRQDEPFGVQPEQRGFEILAPLRLAGIEGRIKGLLDERAFLLERRDGKGLRISVDSIQRVRHHHVPITPPGITCCAASNNSFERVPKSHIPV